MKPTIILDDIEVNSMPLLDAYWELSKCLSLSFLLILPQGNSLAACLSDHINFVKCSYL